MNALFKLILAVLISGTAGVATAYVPLPPSVLLTVQFLLATLVLSLLLVLRKSSINKGSVRSHAVSLILSGGLLGVGAALAVEAMAYTGGSAAYMTLFTMPLLATVFVPLFLKEKLVSSRLLCLATSLTGAVLLSGFVIGDSFHVTGVLMALGSAACLAGMLVMQKKLARVPTQEMLFYHFLVATVVMVVYVFFTGFSVTSMMSSGAIFWVFALGAVHAVLAGCLFIGALAKLSVQKTALYCYVVPAFAVLCRYLVLGVVPTTFQIIGMVLIFASTVISEFISKK